MMMFKVECQGLHKGNLKSKMYSKFVEYFKNGFKLISLNHAEQ